MKYWLYSLYHAIYPCILFVLYIAVCSSLFPYPYLASSFFPVTAGSHLACFLHLWVCFCYTHSFYFLESTCKRYHRAFVFDFKHNAFQVCLCCRKWPNFSFLWLIVYRMHVWRYISIYHIFFIHLSVDGHLDCFHILANI